MKKFLAKSAAAVAAAGSALSLMALTVHAQVLSASEAGTMADGGNDVAHDFLVAAPFAALIGGLIALAWALRTARAAKNGRIPRV